MPMENDLPTTSCSVPAFHQDTLRPGTHKQSSKWDQLPVMENLGNLSRKEKRKTLKKLKRKAIRKEVAEKERAEEEARLNDPATQLELQLQEQAEAEAVEKARKQFEEQERIWLENHKKATEEAQRKQQAELQRQQEEQAAQKEEEENWEYVEEGPAEIIWQGNEIIVQKKKIRVPKKNSDAKVEDSDQPISNPLPPQHTAFADYQKVTSSTTGLKVFDGIDQQIPNFGTEQDKAHCPFHIKTGACRFGARCSRAHFYPDKSCTLLMKSMYNGPGLTWEQDEGLEYTDEEVALHYDEFYEDVHTEFLKFGELVNFKVCGNASAHLRGNVYVHYQSLDSAIAAYNAINGRFFAGKQITCEFIGVTRWKVAICGEYMKSRHKNCSHGSACNFLHCFRNPGGEYEWADWDNPPPRSWMIKMDMLFGGSRITQYDNHKLRERDNRNSHGYSNRSSCRRSSRQHKLRERDCWSSDDNETKYKEHTTRKYSSKEERDTRSDSDQASDVYNRKANKRRRSHNRGASDKTRRGESEMSEEDNEITDRSHRRTDRSMHVMNKKRHHRDHSCEDDTGDKKKRADSVDSDRTGKKHSESRRGSCVRLDDDHNVVKYKSKDTRSDSDQDSDVYNRKANKIRCSQNRGASDKTKRGENEMSEEDKEITDRAHQRTDRSMHRMNRKRHHREQSCEDDTNDKKRRADSVDSDLTGKKHSDSRRGSCVRLDDDHNVVKYKSKDRLTLEREDGLQSLRSEKKKRSRESRRSQDHVKESMDQEKMKLSRGNHSSKSPQKNRERERLQRWHGDHKSPRRVKNYYQSQGRDQGKSLSPEKDQHRSKLLKRSRNFSRTPKSSEEDSLDDVDRWQASDDSVI